MPWLKVDDGEGMAPWVFQVGNEVYGVYVRLGNYSAQHLTDGLVPAAIAQMIAGDVNGDGSSKSLLTLRTVGRITIDDLGTVRLPFYLDSNPSRAQVEQDRESTRQRQAEWRAKRRQPGGGT